MNFRSRMSTLYLLNIFYTIYFLKLPIENFQSLFGDVGDSLLPGRDVEGVTLAQLHDLDEWKR
jgi:hypothetical protein